MKRETCPRCHGAGTIVVEDAEARCEAEIDIGSETIHCFASRQHPDAPHMAIVASPCYACGGYDEHHDSCAVYLAEPCHDGLDDWWGWNDGDVALTRHLVNGREWRIAYQPGSPWAQVFGSARAS